MRTDDRAVVIDVLESETCFDNGEGIFITYKMEATLRKAIRMLKDTPEPSVPSVAELRFTEDRRIKVTVYGSMLTKVREYAEQNVFDIPTAVGCLLNTGYYAWKAGD